MGHDGEHVTLKQSDSHSVSGCWSPPGPLVRSLIDYWSHGLKHLYNLQISEYLVYFQRCVTLQKKLFVCVRVCACARACVLERERE